MKLTEDINRQKEIMRIANFSDLTKSGDWDAKRHVRARDGVHMFRIIDGVLQKIDKQPNIKNLYRSKIEVFYLTDMEADRINGFLKNAQDLEKEALKQRKAAKFLLYGTKD